MACYISLQESSCVMFLPLVFYNIVLQQTWMPLLSETKKILHVLIFNYQTDRGKSYWNKKWNLSNTITKITNILKQVHAPIYNLSPLSCSKYNFGSYIIINNVLGTCMLLLQNKQCLRNINAPLLHNSKGLHI